MSEEQNAMQLRFLNLQDFTSMVAVIDTVANRGAFKAEEFSAVGAVREKLIAETQHQSQVLQQAQGASTTEQFGGTSFEESEEPEPEVEVAKANKKRK